MTRSMPIAAALLFCVAGAQAQFGLPTPKLPSTPTASAPGAKPPKCDAGAPTVTNELVARYIKALQARDSMMGVIAKENSPTGQYYAALIQQRDLERRRSDFEAQTGPDWDKYAALQKRMMSGDTAAMRAMQSAVPDPQSVTVPHLPWETQQAGNDRLDVAAEHAGGFDHCGWTAVVDVMPMLVSALATNPNVTSQHVSAWGHPNGFSASEIAAARAHRIELAQLLGVRYKTDAAIAAEHTPPAAAAMPAAAAGGAGTQKGMAAYTACMQKESQPATDYLTKNKDAIDAAKKSGDNAALMQYMQTVQQLQMAAVTKCSPLMR